MSESDWRGTALVGIGVLSCLAPMFLATWLVSAYLTENRVQAEQTTREHASNAHANAKEECLRLDPIAIVDCVEEHVRAVQETERAEHDLNAQREMATWALGVFVVSALTAGVTAVGVFLVYQTLKEARKTTNAAIRSAREASAATGVANQGARAAMEANAIMRHEQRPWLEITRELECRFKKVAGSDKFMVQCRYEIANVGKSPAFDVSISNMLVRTTFGDDVSAALTEAIAVAESARGSRIGETVIYPGSPPKKSRMKLGATLEGDGEDICLIVCVSYTGLGIDKRAHESRVFWVLDDPHGDQEDYTPGLDVKFLIEQADLRSVQ